MINIDKKKVLLIIMDGYGLAPKNKFNAISEASTPNLDMIFSKYPTARLAASGKEVGLPEGQMGNSEVGHANIGAGRVVYQDLTFINNSIENGDFYNNEVLNAVMDSVKESGSVLHLMGLCSSGGVHSHINHLFAVLQLAKRKNLTKVAIHFWADGRDTEPKSALKHLNDLEGKLKEYGIGKVETVCGRFYAMDRDSNYERTKIAADAILYGNGIEFEKSEEVILKAYEQGLTDEFLPAYVRKGYAGMNDCDSVICFNYRPDRARQITAAVKDKVKNYVCFTQYDEKFENVEIAFKSRKIDLTLGECVSNQGMKQLRIAETEKYAHVTFFFNNGIENPYKNEDRIIIDSPKVKTYDLKPEMSAKKITSTALEMIKSDRYNLIVLNFANPDMVGHTGNIEATVKAVETVDGCVGELVKCMNESGGVTIITADHGNAEKMRDEFGNPHTSHTCNLVPLSVIGYDCELKPRGSLCDIAPTICEILEIKKPDEMSGKSLIVNYEL